MKRYRSQLNKKKLLTRETIIVGAGENGYVIRGILAYDKSVKVIGFLDDAKDGRDILGKISELPKYQKRGCCFFVSIGTNSARKKVFSNLQKARVKFINAIHPSAIIEPGVQLGVNIMIGAHSYVNAGSSIGDNTFINNGCIVEHDNHIGQHCHLAPGAVTGGGVKIGDCTFIGLNSTVRDHKSVGDNVVVGMSAAVVGDVPSDITVVGNPARIKMRKI